MLLLLEFKNPQVRRTGQATLDARSVAFQGNLGLDRNGWRRKIESLV